MGRTALQNEGINGFNHLPRKYRDPAKHLSAIHQTGHRQVTFPVSLDWEGML